MTPTPQSAIPCVCIDRCRGRRTRWSTEFQHRWNSNGARFGFCDEFSSSAESEDRFEISEHIWRWAGLGWVGLGVEERKQGRGVVWGVSPSFLGGRATASQTTYTQANHTHIQIYSLPLHNTKMDRLLPWCWCWCWWCGERDRDREEYEEEEDHHSLYVSTMPTGVLVLVPHTFSSLLACLFATLHSFALHYTLILCLLITNTTDHIAT